MYNQSKIFLLPEHTFLSLVGGRVSRASFFYMKNKWEISCFGWNKISGVYCIMSYDEKPKIHYIGSSKDIGKRLSSSIHPYRKLLNSGISVYVKFKETDNYIELEKSLIKRIKPELNYIHNG